ncbi:MAG TPA: hypothetical protein VEW04_03870 [Allosphingosinicella sp.]|nr:hypothetical protein [Allosphingosinicella sp.]
MAATDIDQLRRHSLWLSRLTLVLLVATALVTVAPVLIGFALAPARGLPPALAFTAVLWMPVPFYLYALWAIRGAFRGFAAGGTFGPAIAAGCTRAGFALAIGGTLSAVGVPNVMRVLHGQGGILSFDVAYLAVGVVGLAMILLGRLLARAAAIEDELGGFF